jgi:hypothetical protein
VSDEVVEPIASALAVAIRVVAVRNEYDCKAVYGEEN